MKNFRFIFNIFSIFIFLITVSYFSVRLLYFRNYSKKNKGDSKILYEKILKQEKDYFLVSEIKEVNNIHYFIGNSENNYVNYKGLIWRIIKINEDNSITLILDSSITNMKYDNIAKWLNESSDIESGVLSKTFYNNGIIINKESRTLLEDNTLYCKYDDLLLTMLSYNDYYNCGEENSFINNNTDFWILSDDYTYKYVDEEGKINNEEEDKSHNVRPVITIPSDSKISSGYGTIDKPYYIKRDKATGLVSEIEVGSYIRYNYSIWKVMENSDNKLKLVNEDCIRNEENECISMQFSKYNNEINLEDSESLLYYLNHEYYENFKHTEYLTEGKFYIGKYKDDDYSSVYSDYISAKIGLPTLADPLAFSIDNTFLMTSDANNDLNIFITHNNKAFETLVTEQAYIRPVIYIKGDIKVKGGKGSYVSPYTLGGLQND